MNSLERALNQYNWCPYKMWTFGHRDRHTQGECHVKVGTVLPQAKELPEAGREARPWAFPNTFRGSMALISCFQPLELGDNKFLLFKLLSLRYFVTAVLANYYTVLMCHFKMLSSLIPTNRGCYGQLLLTACPQIPSLPPTMTVHLKGKAVVSTCNKLCN